VTGEASKAGEEAPAAGGRRRQAGVNRIARVDVPPARLTRRLGEQLDLVEG
jgi:hypothetical protein